MKKIVAVLIAACMLAGTAGALEEPSIIIDSLTGICTVSGNLGAAEREETLKLMVLKPNTDITKIQGSDIAWVEEKYPDADGKYEFVMRLGPNAPAGQYQFVLQNRTTGRKIFTSTYLTTEHQIGLLKELDALTPEKIPEWLNINAENFDLQRLPEFTAWESLSTQSKEVVCGILAGIPFAPEDDGSNVVQKVELLRQEVRNGIVLGRANDIASIEELARHLEDYQDIIAVPESIQKRMQDFPQSGQETVLQNLVDTSFETLPEIRKAYAYEVIAQTVETASHWSEIQELCSTEKEFLPVNSERLANVSSGRLHLVYTPLLGKRFSSLEKIVQALDAAAADALSSSGGGSGGSSSGGGGGRGSGQGTVFQPAPELEMTEEEKAAEEEKNSIFTDLENTSWAREYIEELAKRNVISGYGEKRFGPNDPVTRGQFVKMVVGAFGLKGELLKTARFEDVGTEHMFAESVEIAYGLGIINGLSDNCFGVDTPITRQDAAVILSRTLAYVGEETAEPENMGFADKEQVAAYAKAAVAQLAAAGVINGREGNRFCPLEQITRAESAKIIYISAENTLKREVQ